MTLGISGSGPYGLLRSLRQENQADRYELELIAQGFRRPHSKNLLLKNIAMRKKRIKEILTDLQTLTAKKIWEKYG